MTEVCGEFKVFEREVIARTPRAEVTCTKPKHPRTEAHEAMRGSTLYTWRTPPCTCSWGGPDEGCPHHGRCASESHPTDEEGRCHCGMVP